MKIIWNDFIPVRGSGAVNLFGVLFARRDAVISETTLRHEHIHAMQMREMLYVPFYLWYGVEYAVRLAGRGFGRKPCGPGGGPRDRTGFEREARGNEHDADYPKTREPFGWLKYI